MSILCDVRDYVQNRKQASLTDLSNHFHTPPEAMRGIVDQWVVRGTIKQCQPSACGQCSLSCASMPGDSYEWVDQLY